MNEDEGLKRLKAELARWPMRIQMADQMSMEDWQTINTISRVEVMIENVQKELLADEV